MKKPTHSEGNVYSVQPRKVNLTEGERKILANDAREAIDEAFLFANFSETLATIWPLELDPVTKNDTYDTLTLGIPYDRADISATVDHDDGDAFLRSAKIRLFRLEWQRIIRSELVINTGDDDIDEGQEEIVEHEDPMFYLDTPKDSFATQNERIPLNYAMCRELLNYIVSQANPIASITNSDRSMLESIEALLAVSDETSLSRSTKYRFNSNNSEQIVVDVHDRALIRPKEAPKHAYHEANIEKIRSFGKAGTLATSLRLRVSDDETIATIGKEYTYDDNVADDIEMRIQDVTDEHDSLSIDSAKEFGRQVIDSLHLLATKFAGVDEAEQLEY